jgi:hypothetical protein
MDTAVIRKLHSLAGLTILIVINLTIQLGLNKASVGTLDTLSIGICILGLSPHTHLSLNQVGLFCLLSGANPTTF